MRLGDSLFKFSRVAVVVLAAGILCGCSERKPAGPPEGATATESQPVTPAATSTDSETESK
jgi:PBP1b-binding outer membrane lipoprotein LpoB